MRLKILFMAVFTAVLTFLEVPTFASEEFSTSITVAYNAEDSTDNIRKAILQAKANPGREKIVLSNQGMGTTTWVSGPIYLGDNMELHLEENVTLRAKSGAFTNQNQPFINIEEKTDVKISGADCNTSKISMPIEEYTSGENRHSISILGGENVTVEELYIDKSGGDGVCINDKHYLRGELTTKKNKNILLENLICDANARNGISIISGDSINVNNCKCINTGKLNPEGLASGGPWAGISSEAEYNRPLNNVTITNCLIENTRNRGLDIAMKKLCNTSDFDMSISDCEVKECPFGIVVARMGQSGQISGAVNFEKCLVSDAGSTTVVVREWENDSAALSFKNCAFINPAGESQGVFNFRDSTLENNTGNVKFENVFVFNDRATDKVGYIINLSNSDGNIIPGPITGTIKYNNVASTVLYGSEEDEKDGMKVEFTLDTVTNQEEFIEDIGFTGYRKNN